VIWPAQRKENDANDIFGSRRIVPARPENPRHPRAYKELQGPAAKGKRPYYPSLVRRHSGGVKPSPWYYDNNVPSLYRARFMAHAALAGVVISRGHELTETAFEFLRGFRLQLPNTFATLPAILKEWEAAYSARIDAEIKGVLKFRHPDSAEIDSLNAWTKGAFEDLKGQSR
jgi:hypothetical protein